ncbi:hypothetical protein [Pseudomonas atacamensis]|jgi:hypothetical protein|uniref:hypothetical protein n=1 Tax=Pseudomonas atacamensis TaxID=2565368 RepID=UPI002B1D168C|nr:hypothetical protein [Pseudomonas atacamensis]
MSDTQPDTDQLKNVEFYAANLNAWFNTRFEHDKSLLSLSAGAVGLLITLISAVGVRSVEILILYVLALACFVICLGALLWIFRRNAKHLEDVVGEVETKDQLLDILDRVAVISFMLGVIFSSIIGISTAIHSYTDKVTKMTDKKTSSDLVISQDSFSGVAAMKPVSKTESSVNNINNMRPVASPKKTEPAKKEGDK